MQLFHSSVEGTATEAEFAGDCGFVALVLRETGDDETPEQIIILTGHIFNDWGFHLPLLSAAWMNML